MKLYNCNQLTSMAIFGAMSVVSGFVIHSSSIICSRIADDKDNDPVLGNISTEQGSWIGSTLILGETLGYSISCYLESSLGHRRSLILDAMLLMLGSAIQVAGSRIPILCLGRTIIGISVSSSRISSLNFAREVLGMDGLETLGFFFLLGRNLGALLMSILGSFISSWRIALGGFTIPLSLINLMGLIFFVNDSPSWILKGKKSSSDIDSSIGNYSGKDQKEAEAAMSMWTSTGMSNFSGGRKTFKQKLEELRYEYLSTQFLYLTVSFVLLEWSSFPVLSFYYVNVLKLFDVPLSPYISSAILNGINLILSVGVWLVIISKGYVNLPKKQMYFSSGAILIASLTAVSTYGSLADFMPLTSSYTSNLNWIPMVMFGLIQCSYLTGYGQIPLYYLYSYENCSSKNIRAIFVMSSVSSFIAVKTAPMIIESLKVYGIFWIFTMVVLLNLSVSYYLIPDEEEEALEDQTIVNDVIIVRSTSPQIKKASLCEKDPCLKCEPGLHGKEAGQNLEKVTKPQHT